MTAPSATPRPARPSGAPRLLVIQHEDECPPAWFGPWLAAAGVDLRLVAAHRGDPVPPRLVEDDALMVLGGEMGANDDDRFPWLVGTKELIRWVVAEKRPFLGICLGHQLATVALGGEVARNPSGHAAGLTPVALTDEGKADHLVAGIDGRLSIQWNGDIAARLPDGSVSLATAPDGSNQAARFGERAWGVQFHPEASPDVFRSWVTDRVSGAMVSERARAAAAQIDEASDELRRSWMPLALRFAEIVRG